MVTKRVFVFMERYSVITDKRPRELVLLRGRGCAYKRCTFCDYHLDRSSDAAANLALNAAVLSRVTGTFGELEVINSGSVFELGAECIELIRSVCAARNISVVHFESHYMYKDRLDELRREFDGVTVLFKLGLETFDSEFREKILHKGIPDSDPSVISRGFDEANFLFGLGGQTVESMRRDIELGLKYFKRICLNVMCENTTAVKPDPAVVSAFLRELYPLCKNDDRIDVLISNLDFGVGEIN